MGTTNILDLNNRLTKVEKENVAQNSYTSLKNKPKINNVTLTGNKSLKDIGAASIPIGQSTLGTGFITAFHDGNSYHCFVPFPFWASDSNYTITLNGVTQVNVGDVLASAVVETKYRTGFALAVSGTYDYSKCGIAVNYTITLN